MVIFPRNCISWTPLDVAVSVGDVETVEYLLNQKVPVDTPDREKVFHRGIAFKWPSLPGVQ